MKINVEKIIPGGAKYILKRNSLGVESRQYSEEKCIKGVLKENRVRVGSNKNSSNSTEFKHTYG